MQVAASGGSQGFLYEVVAGNVDGIDPVHPVGVRAQGTPAISPGIERSHIRNKLPRRLRVAAGRFAKAAEDRGVVVLEPGTESELRVHARRPRGTVLPAEIIQ